MEKQKKTLKIVVVGDGAVGKYIHIPEHYTCIMLIILFKNN